jgi:hypothetical protein
MSESLIAALIRLHRNRRKGGNGSEYINGETLARYVREAIASVLEGRGRFPPFKPFIVEPLIRESAMTIKGRPYVIRFDGELLGRVEATRPGDASFSDWVRAVLWYYVLFKTGTSSIAHYRKRTFSDHSKNV